MYDTYVAQLDSTLYSTVYHKKHLQRRKREKINDFAFTESKYNITDKFPATLLKVAGK